MQGKLRLQVRCTAVKGVPDAAAQLHLHTRQARQLPSACFVQRLSVGRAAVLSATTAQLPQEAER